MPLQKRAESGLYTIEEDSRTGATVYTWEQYASGERFREGANDLLEYIRENDVTKLVVDTSEIQAHDDADQEWLEEEWIPKILDAGVTASVTVHKDSVIAEMDMEQFMEDVEDMPYDAYMTDDIDDALDWIADQ
jgi:hypothetical protein